MTYVVVEDLSSLSAQSYMSHDETNGGWTGPVSLGNTVSLRRFHARDSVVTPHFFRLKKRYLPINYYAKATMVISDPVFSWSAPAVTLPITPNSHKWTYFYSTSCLAYGCSVDNMIAYADDPTQQAIARLLEKLSSTKVNTLVPAAEMHKTAHHMAKTATRLLGALRALKHGDFRMFTTELGITETVYQRKKFNRRYKKAEKADPFLAKKATTDSYNYDILLTQQQKSRMSNFLSETWLEYSYGWKPMLKDVFDHAQALAELSISRQNVVRSASASAKTSKLKDFGYSTSFSPLIRNHSVFNDQRWVKIGVKYRLQAGELNTFSQLGIDNPLEVAWELVPFSFVADWFIPVGSFLRSLTATNGLIFHEGFKSIRNVRTSWSTFEPSLGTQDSGGIRYGPIAGTSRAQMTKIDIIRSKLSSFPSLDIPRFKDPRSGDDYGLRKALSAVALLQQFFLSGKAPSKKYF